MSTVSGPVVWVHTIDDVRVGALANVYDLEIDEQLQATHTIQFTIDANDPKSGLVVVDGIVEVDDVRFRILEVTAERDGSRMLLRVRGDALWCDLLNGLFSVPITGTISAGLQALIDQNGYLGGWTVGTVESDGGSWVYEPDGILTTLGVMRNWAALVGREVVFDTVARTVSLVLEQGSDTGRTFRYGRDVVSVSRTIEPPEATRVYPRGKDNLTITAINAINPGQSYIEDLTFYTDQGYDLSLAESFGRHDWWIAEQYTNAVQLYDAAVARLATLSQPRYSYKLAVADLAELTGSDVAVEVGDRVRVVDLDLGVNVETRVVRLVRRPFEPSADTVELSFLQSGLSESRAVASGGGGGGSAFSVFSSVSVEAFTVTSSIYTPNVITLTLPGATDVVTGVEVAGTASGTGTVTAQLYWGTEPVGVEVRQAFVSGPFQLGIPQVLQGLDGSRNLNLRLRVTSGTGTVSVASSASTLYAIASNAAGAASSDPSIDINDPVSTTPVTVAETVTLTNPP